MKNKTIESKEFFCENCGKIKYENDITKDKKTKKYVCKVCKNTEVYEVNYIIPDISTAKDEALLIRNYCKSITVAANRILKAQDHFQAQIELSYLQEKITKLNFAYKFLKQALK
jgi:hypothetical protein